VATLKSLAKDTAIYGMSSIVGKFLNYLLVPLYTVSFSVESGGYGDVTNIYAIVALLQVLLIYGMETGFFRFVNKRDENEQIVYSSILISVGSTSLLFVALCLLFLSPISSALGYATHPEYIGIMAAVVAMDAFQSIPFAYLRHKKRPIKFASIKLFSIVFGIGLNLFFLLLCPWLTKHTDMMTWYRPEYGVGYVFIANFITSFVQFFFFIPELRGFRWKYDAELMKRIFRYSFPLLILGVVGILNQTVDKILFPFLYDKDQAMVQLGIYGAATKIAMVMAMCTQAFRYAYEPFVFGSHKEEGDHRPVYARAMKFFVIFSLLGFLAVIFYLDILRYIIAPDYWEGLKVVPIVMGAEIFMGVYFNLSFWYKLIDQTKWGAYFSLIGCAIIVGLNIWLVPRYGYMACAWAGLTGYAVITLLSFVIGQRKYPICYELKNMGAYLLLATVLFLLARLWVPGSLFLRLAYRTCLLIIFLLFIVKRDFPEWKSYVHK
jgi:O-antigen/teichoic acid export membrane protein